MQRLFLRLTRMNQPIVEVIIIFDKAALILEFFLINFQGLLAAILSGFIIVQVEMNTSRVPAFGEYFFQKTTRNLRSKNWVNFLSFL